MLFIFKKWIPCCCTSFSNRSKMTSKCGKNKKVAHELKASVSPMFLPHVDVFCDLLGNRPWSRPTAKLLVSSDNTRWSPVVKNSFSFRHSHFLSWTLCVSVSPFFFFVKTYSSRKLFAMLLLASA